MKPPALHALELLAEGADSFRRAREPLEMSAQIVGVSWLTLESIARVKAASHKTEIAGAHVRELLRSLGVEFTEDPPREQTGVPVSPGTCSPRRALSPDKLIVENCIHVAREHRVKDPFHVAKQTKNWARDR